MKLLAIERSVSGVTDAACKPFLEAEARRAYALHQRGFIRELYFRADRAEAVLVLECESVTRARLVLKTLPLVRQGLISFEVIPLVAYPGFSRLFGSRTRDGASATPGGHSHRPRPETSKSRQGT